MKKFLLAFAAAAIMAGSADAMYLIGQPAGEWSPAIGIEMTEVEGGWEWTGVIGTEEYFAFATELLPSGDWNEFNTNYRLSPSADGNIAYEGEYSLHLGTPESAIRGIGVECTYTVSEKDGEYSLKVVATGDEPVVPTPYEITSMAVIGQFNDWNPETEIEMEKIAEGVWHVELPQLSGKFKLRANDSWDINFGTGGGYGMILRDGSYRVGENGGDFNIAQVSNVSLRLDILSNTISIYGTDWVLELPPIALRGSMNGWDWNEAYLLTESGESGIYTFELDVLEAGSEFKIASEDWGVEFTTATQMQAGDVYTLVGGGNMSVTESYKDVVLILDIVNNTFSFTGTVTSGVSEIISADTEAVYYNLQGVKVENPAGGIYIRVANDKISKVILK